MDVGVVVVGVVVVVAAGFFAAFAGTGLTTTTTGLPVALLVTGVFMAALLTTEAGVVPG